MNQKTFKILYYISTALLTGLMLFSASMYFTKTEMVRGFFTSLGYPSYLVIPLAIAKILGLIAVWTRKSSTLKEWAYAGFFFDTVLALTAHLHASDGGYLMSGAGILLVLVSYISEKKAFHVT